jgi:hypothetical protein
LLIYLLPSLKLPEIPVDIVLITRNAILGSIHFLVIRIGLEHDLNHEIQYINLDSRFSTHISG